MALGRAETDDGGPKSLSSSTFLVLRSIRPSFRASTAATPLWRRRSVCVMMAKDTNILREEIGLILVCWLFSMYEKCMDYEIRLPCFSPGPVSGLNHEFVMIKVWNDATAEMRTAYHARTLRDRIVKSRLKLDHHHFFPTRGLGGGGGTRRRHDQKHPVADRKPFGGKF